jgi:hypothetical protein
MEQEMIYEETVKYESLDEDERNMVDNKDIRLAMRRYLKRTNMKSICFVFAVTKYRSDKHLGVVNDGVVN